MDITILNIIFQKLSQLSFQLSSKNLDNSEELFLCYILWVQVNSINKSSSVARL